MSLVERARALIASPRVRSSRPPTQPLQTHERAPDLDAFYAVCDGLELDDGTVILGQGEIGSTTAWLKEDRSLDWDDDLEVIGERDDLVIVRDHDRRAGRAGGGVLEAPTDGLSSFRRAALDLITYLEERAGIAALGARAPERAALAAIEAKDAAALAAALARPFYPGAERSFSQAALALGALRAEAGEAEGAFEAFTRSAAARARAAPRGAEASELAAAWRACAIAASKAGAKHLAERCAAEDRGGRVR